MMSKKKKDTDIFQSIENFRARLDIAGVQDDTDVVKAIIESLPPQTVYSTAIFEWICPNCAESHDSYDLEESECEKCGLKVELTNDF